MIRLPKFGLYIGYDLYFWLKLEPAIKNKRSKLGKLNDVRMNDSKLLPILSVLSHRFKLHQLNWLTI